MSTGGRTQRLRFRRDSVGGTETLSGLIGEGDVVLVGSERPEGPRRRRWRFSRAKGPWSSRAERPGRVIRTTRHTVPLEHMICEARYTESKTVESATDQPRRRRDMRRTEKEEKMWRAPDAVNDGCHGYLFDQGRRYLLPAGMKAKFHLVPTSGALTVGTNSKRRAPRGAVVLGWGKAATSNRCRGRAGTRERRRLLASGPVRMATRRRAAVSARSRGPIGRRRGMTAVLPGESSKR